MINLLPHPIPFSHHVGGAVPYHQGMGWVSSSCWWVLDQQQLPLKETEESILPLRKTDDASFSFLSPPSSLHPFLQAPANNNGDQSVKLITE